MQTQFSIVLVNIGSGSKRVKKKYSDCSKILNIENIPWNIENL